MNKGNITRRFVQVLNRMVRYWPSSAFTFWWTQMELRYIKKEKKKQEREKGQYSAILTEKACSIKDNLHDKKIIPRFVTIEEIHETRCGFLAQSVERRVWGRNHWVHTSLDWTDLPSSSIIQLYHPALPSSSLGAIQMKRDAQNEKFFLQKRKMTCFWKWNVIIDLAPMRYIMLHTKTLVFPSKTNVL